MNKIIAVISCVIGSFLNPNISFSGSLATKMFSGPTADIYNTMRNYMVDSQLVRRGVKNAAVLESMRKVPRHLFVPQQLWSSAYEDTPLPIGQGQTISQPYIVAFMAEAAQIQKNDKILEVGSGCGYSAAVLSNLGKAVYTIESVKDLFNGASRRLTPEHGYDNVHVFYGDGSVGLSENAPYDAIIVTAAAPSIPRSLKAQLNINGRLIIPVKTNSIGESLFRVTKRAENVFEEEALLDVRFVPLIGKEGWAYGDH